MTYTEYKETLCKAFSENLPEIKLSEDAIDRFYRFSSILIETNKTFNLTAITDEKDVILKHFVDCATISKHIPANSRIIDVGCGAGFPSIPIAILRSDLSIASLDSTGKKTSFIGSCAKELGLGNINAVCARAEDFAEGNREQFDVCTSRAVARMNVLAEICIPLVSNGGKFIAMKSSKGGEEYAEAKQGICKLGCSLESSEKIALQLDESKIEREIYVFKKEHITPKQYPRKYAQILKKPL